MLTIRSFGLAWVVAGVLLSGCGRKDASDALPPGRKSSSGEKPVPRLSVGVTNAAVSMQTATHTPTNAVSGKAATNVVVAAMSADPATNQPLAATVQPAAGLTEPGFLRDLAKIRELEEDAQFTEAIRLCRTMSDTHKDREQQGALAAIMARLNDARDEAVDLRQSIKYLASGNLNYIQVAQDKLRNAGETGRIFLRKAVREEKDAAAMIAARILIEQTDIQAYPVFAAEMARRDYLPLVALMGQGMKVRIQNLQTNTLATLHGAVLTDTNMVRREMAGVLVVAYDQRCRKDPGPYNQLVGSPDGFETLRTYVERALTSTDTQVVAWACEQGGSLAGLFNSALARYQADTQSGSLTHERAETQIAISGYGQPPFPGGPANNFSARWTAFIEIPQAGKYVFYASADDRGSVSVGTQIVFEVGGQEVSAAAEFDPGLVPISAEFTQAEHGYGFRVHMSGPDMPRRLVDSGVLRLSPWKDAVLALRPAIRDLVSTNWTAARSARARLAWGFTTGDIYLRDALRNEPDSVAVRAAEWLVSRRDARAPALLIERIERNLASPAMPDLTVALRSMAPILSPDQIRHLYKTMRRETDPSMLPHASALCAVLDDVCGNDRALFNKTVQDPEAYDQLERYVRRALISSNETAVVNACEYGLPFTPYLAGGLRGQYFYGQQFDEFALDRLESRLESNTRDNPHPLPENVRNDSSIRWTGFLRIDKPNAYTFHSRSHRGTTLFIDDRPAVSSWNWEEQRSTPVVLKAGWHPLNVEGSIFIMGWSWTNAAQHVIAGNVFRTPIWRSALLTIPPAIDNLASTNSAQVLAAAATLAQVQEFAPIFLRNAIRHKADPVAKAAAAALADRYDAPTAALLIERIRKTPDSPIVPDLLENLRNLAGQIPPDLVPPLCEAIARNSDARMIPEASMLCIILDRTCAGKASEFNRLANDPKAYEQLKSYVAKVCASANDAVVMRAAQFGSPFVGPVAGLRGRYYRGTYFEDIVLDRLDSAAAIPYRSFPWPGNQMRSVSVRWDGLLNVERAGDYTFDLNSGSWQGLLIDGTPVQFQGEWNRRTNRVALAAGVHPIRVTLQQWNDGEIGGQLDWAGPGFGRRIIGPDALRTPLWPDALARLPNAISNIVSTNWAAVSAAKATLLQAGEAGHVFLRNAIRHKPDPVARAAAAILAEQYDAPAAALLIERIRKTPASAIVPDLLENLRELAASIPADSLAPLLDAVRADKDIRMIPEAAMLCMVLDRTCGGNADAFNKLVNDAKAYGQLMACVESAGASAEKALLERAAIYGAPFIAPAPGLRGRYYLGQQFDVPAFERRDSAVNIPNGQFPTPNRQQGDISARWTGSLLAKQAGTYVLYVARSHARVQLWVDGTYLPLQPAPNEPIATNAIVLSNGMHRIRMDLQHGTEGQNNVSLSWSGPGASRQIVSTETLSTPLWPAELAKLQTAINSLGSTNKVEFEDARTTILQAGGAGRLYLKNAAASGKGPVAEAAAKLLTP